MKSNAPLLKAIGVASAGDPYLPESGNSGYHVTHYDLDVDYRVSSNRLSGAVRIAAIADERLERFTLDLCGLTASKVSVNGERAAKVTQSPTKLTIRTAAPVEAGAGFTIAIRYAGSPSPRNTAWGDVGWEELSEGVLVAGQPSGAPSWFPCNDHPSDKATFRTAVTADSSYRVIANGRLVSRTVKSSRTRWVFETAEPLASYLATVQIGHYEAAELPPASIPQHAFIPRDLRADFAADFAEQPAMIALFEQAFGPYPFSDYTVVVTDDDLEIPLEAHGISVFGRNHVDGHRGSNRLVAHELAHSWFGNSLTVSAWQHIWLHEGFACYAEWLWSEASGGPSAHRFAEQQWGKLKTLPQDLVIGDPGPELMFDDRLYKRGALALHALRLSIGDRAFFETLRAWTTAKRHGSVSTEEFLDHVATRNGDPTRVLLSAWLFETALPPLPKPRR
ncbi:M1 family metallopeptidase [Luethyella okanaganae]|uniref:Aminopeptidase N n=1 Tax=Luethyella okanaganae TaxID=69372 RepID=A0ABW1VHD9_9MICO